MSTSVAVNTYAHTATYIAGKIMLTLKEIVRETGLDPLRLSDDWPSVEGAIAFWLNSRHLQRVTLEISSGDPKELVGRWDLEITYSNSGSDGAFWTDTDLIRQSILKAGKQPSSCDYRFVLRSSAGRPDYGGWGPTSLLSTEKFLRYSLGSQIGAPGAGVETAYWIKK